MVKKKSGQFEKQPKKNSKNKMYSHIKNSAEGRVMKLEDRSVEITQIISQRKKEKYKEVKRHGEEK